MSKVSREQAESEIESWLDFKRVAQSKRVSTEKNIERMVESMMDGTLIMDPETKVLTQKIKFPFGKEIQITELKYKPRLTAKNIQDALLGVKADDGMGRAFAHIAAATDEDRNVIAKMDSEDYSLAGDIVIFFMF